MKKLLILSLFILTSCETPKDNNPPNGGNPPGTSQTLKVGAFNIQIFGVSKMSKPQVVSALKSIIPRYDLLLIQEIRDASGASIYNLLNEVNAVSGNKYQMEIASRTGRSSSKEQYAFFYNTQKLSVVNKGEYDDGVEPSADIFEREPFMVQFNFAAANITFFAVGIHTKPDDAFNELDALRQVYQDTAYAFDTNNAIILGDFNSDCSYLSDSEITNVSLYQDGYFNWWFDKAGDSTVGSTTCQYDQIVTTRVLTDRVVEGSSQVYNFKDALGLTQMQAEDVSDHFPVEIDLSF